MQISMRTRLFTITAALVLLASCGGGSSDSSGTTGTTGGTTDNAGTTDNSGTTDTGNTTSTGGTTGNAGAIDTGSTVDGNTTGSTTGAGTNGPSISTLITSGSDNTDNATRWTCQGAGATFVQHYYADGSAKTVSADTSEDAFNWSETAANEIQITYVGDTPFSIQNVSFSDGATGIVNGRLDATDSRDNGALTCEKSTVTQSTGLSSMGSIVTGAANIDDTKRWDCGDDRLFAFWETENRGSVTFKSTGQSEFFFWSFNDGSVGLGSQAAVWLGVVFDDTNGLTASELNATSGSTSPLACTLVSYP